MEARILRGVILTAALASLGANYRTTNFLVTAPTSQMAQQVGQAAEKYRKQLAIEWVGRQLPNWQSPCPIRVTVGEHLGAGGATTFMFEGDRVHGWRMSIQGPFNRILDSVLPHEVTHTVFATHFRRPLPRWADEGACTTVEHHSERAKHQKMLVHFLRTGRGISLQRLFRMKEYPHDIMPLYAQGYSIARYLIEQHGRRQFLGFVADGLQDENWRRACKKFYGHESLPALQESWLGWVKQGSPTLALQTRPGVPARLTSGQTDAKQPRPRPNLIHRVPKGSPLTSRTNTDLVPVPGRGSTATLASSQTWRSSSERAKRARSPRPKPPAPSASHEQLARPQTPQPVRQAILPDVSTGVIRR